jgi:ankyrin repeat protein
VRFIVESHNSQDSPSPLETVNMHAKDEVGKTPILEAAASLIDLRREANEAEESECADWIEWVRDRIARGEQLIHFLLDRGCLATDDIPPAADFGPFLNDTGIDNGQSRGSVLGLAVSRASGRLVQRPIDLGADVYFKHHQFHDVVSLHFLNREFYTHDITTLDIASLFWNAEVVKLLLDHLNHQSKVQINTGLDLLSFSDSTGRLLLHLATRGPGISECRLPDEETSFRITETSRLLLEQSPKSINLADDAGSTPLHYVARAHATCGGSQHAELAIRTLLEYGTDTTIADDGGRTVLHILGYSSLGRDPIGTGLLELLVAHGININHADQNGNTALHIMADNLSQLSTARFLLDHGADV